MGLLSTVFGRDGQGNDCEVASWNPWPDDISPGIRLSGPILEAARPGE